VLLVGTLLCSCVFAFVLLDEKGKTLAAAASGQHPKLSFFVGGGNNIVPVEAESNAFIPKLTICGLAGKVLLGCW